MMMSVMIGNSISDLVVLSSEDLKVAKRKKNQTQKIEERKLKKLEDYAKNLRVKDIQVILKIHLFRLTA